MLFILASVTLNVFLAIVITSKTLFVFLSVVYTSVHIELTHGSYVVFVIVHTFNKISIILYLVFAFVDNSNTFYGVIYVVFKMFI